MSTRRAFLVTLASGLLAAPLTGVAQQTAVYRVGMLLQGSPEAWGPSMTKSRRILFDTFRELGYIEGQNLVIDRRFAESNMDRFAGLAAELVALKPDVILAESTPGGIAAMRATSVTPIVLVNVSDPVGNGLVATLARPGGNITGVTDFGVELAAKELDVLHALFPKATRFSVLMSDNPVHPFQLKAIQDAARAISLTAMPERATSLEELDGAFAAMARKNVGAFILLGGPPFTSEASVDKVVALAAKTKIPGMYPSQPMASRAGRAVELWSEPGIYLQTRRHLCR